MRYYVNKYENLSEVDKFLEKSKFSKMTQEEREN